MAITLPRKEGIYRCLRDAPVPFIELVRTLEPAVLTPTPNCRRRAMKAGGQFSDGEISLSLRLVGLALCPRCELQQPLAGEREGSSRWQAVGELPQAAAKSHDTAPAA